MARPMLSEPIGHVLASAAIVDLAKPINVKRLSRTRRSWQAEGWGFYRSLPEVRYPANYIGNALSRFTMRPGWRDPDSPTADPRVPDAKNRPAIIGAAEDTLAALEGPQGGPGEIQRRYGINMNISADGILLGEDGTEEATQWEFLSINEIMFAPDSRGEMAAYRNRFGDDDGQREENKLPRSVYTRRFWHSHPEFSEQADGPLESLAADCRRLMDLNDAISARLLSRLASAGLLFLPNSLSMPVMPNPDDPSAAEQDPVIASIITLMTQAIQTRGTAASVIPIILRGPDDLGEKIKHITLDRVIDEGEMRLRDELRQTITRGQDLPVEVQTELGGSNHWCVDEHTEALTPAGWVSHDRLLIGDQVLTLNPETGMSEWQPVLSLYRADVIEEPMRVMETQNHSSITTMGHRWLVDRRTTQGHIRHFVTSETLNSSCLIPTAAPCADLPHVAKWDDDLVELVAWFGTDGYLRGRSGQIHQSHTRNPERVGRIRSALIRMFGQASDLLRSDSPAWREYKQSNESAFGGPITVFRLNAALTEMLTRHAPDRRISEEFILDLTEGQLHLFTAIAEMADGRHHRQGKTDLWQKNGTATDAYALAAILTGRTVTRYADQGGEQVTINRAVNVRPIKAMQAAGRPTTAPYTGMVWCPTTANGTWMARRRGTCYFTGNSSWSITDSAVSNHLQPMANRYADGLTRVYLHPALLEQGFDPAEVRNVVVIADSSNVITRPNAAEDGRQLHDRIAISDRALRERAGAEEAEAPSDEEYVQNLGRQVHNPYLATYGKPIHDKIDWDKVAAVGASAGAPGVGGTPQSRRPADSSNPVGAPGSGTAGKGAKK